MVSTPSPVSADASGAFGVSSVARGISRSRTAATASAASRDAPPFATITGSITAGRQASSNSRAASSTAAISPSIPVLMASAPMSDSTARAWASTISSGIGWTPVTPRVFCTVTAVTAVAA